jgi:hypothetical protein
MLFDIIEVEHDLQYDMRSKFQGKSSVTWWFLLDETGCSGNIFEVCKIYGLKYMLGYPLQTSVYIWRIMSLVTIDRQFLIHVF